MKTASETLTEKEKQSAIDALASLITQIKEDKVRLISIDMNRGIHRVDDTPDGFVQYEPDTNIYLHIGVIPKKEG